MPSDPSIRGDNPLKQKGSRWGFHVDTYKCYPVTEEDGVTLLTTGAPTGMIEFQVQISARLQCSTCNAERNPLLFL